MSDTQATPGQAAIDHLVRLLQMNPIHQGTEIIDARRDALGLAKEAKGTRRAAAEDVRALRRQVLDQLESIRSQFWAMPINELKEQLDALDDQGFVDLKASIARLRVVAAHRDQFPALSEKPEFDGNFFSLLKDVLIRSPRDTAVVREQILSSFRTRSRRKRGRRMIALLKTEMPAIYELEADWFDALDRQKIQPRVTYVTSSSSHNGTASAGSKSGGASYGWLIWVAICAISGLIRTASNDRHSNNRPHIPSVPNVSNYQFKLPETPEAEKAEGNTLLFRGKDGSEMYATPKVLLFRPGEKPLKSKFPDPSGPSKQSDDRYSR